MSLSKIMTSPVVTVHIDDTLGQAREIFDKTHFHHLLVVEHGVLVGVLSDRDLLKGIGRKVGTPAESRDDLLSLERRVHIVMSRRLVTAHEDESIHDVIARFVETGMSCIPVVDGRHKPVGIISWRDIMRELMRVSKRQNPAPR